MIYLTKTHFEEVNISCSDLEKRAVRIFQILLIQN